jgi:hypothetical protein
MDVRAGGWLSAITCTARDLCLSMALGWPGALQTTATIGQRPRAAGAGHRNGLAVTGAWGGPDWVWCEVVGVS